jgi:hypothetical protein
MSHQKAHYTNTKCMMIPLKNSDRGEVEIAVLIILSHAGVDESILMFVSLSYLFHNQSHPCLVFFASWLRLISRHLKLLKILL